MRRIRISLRGLLLLVTAISLFLGAREWRRQAVLKLCEEIDYGGLCRKRLVLAKQLSTPAAYSGCGINQ